MKRPKKVFKTGLNITTSTVYDPIGVTIVFETNKNLVVSDTSLCIINTFTYLFRKKATFSHRVVSLIY